MFRSGLSIMVPSQSQGLDMLGMLFSANMLKALLVFALLLIVPAHLIWLLARGRDEGLPIAQTYFPGIIDAVFWCAESMAGAAQGHPHRVFARIAAIIWIYAGIIFIAYFTAFATTTMTMNSLRGEINGPGDLRGKKVAVVEGSTSAAYTRELGAVLSSFNDFSSAARAVVEGKAEATVYDTPVIMFYARNDARAQVVGSQFRPESYGIIFPLDSPLRRPVNKALLKLMENGIYEALYKKWFGQAEGEGSAAATGAGGSPSAMRS
jgi:polar amino acid transport system substrate-binding protein